MKARLSLAIVFALTAVVVGEPPKLVTSSPAPWAVRVNSTTQKTVSIAFDQPMRPGFDSWLGRSSVLPSSFGESVLSADHKTFDMNVSLAPGKVYVFGLNEKGLSGVGFQSEKGYSAAPSFLVF